MANDIFYYQVIGLRKIIFFMVLFLSFLFFPIQGYTMDKFAWLPTESSPKYNPMEIVKGDLIFNDDTSLYIPDGKFIHNGWGEMGSTHIVGDDLKPIPTKLSISWFSYTENKFYSGVFKLPYEKIISLFRQGLKGPVTEKNITYNTIVIGLAPEGEVSVWLAAEGIILEVATYKAQEAQINWKEIIDNPEVPRQDYIQMSLEDGLSKEQITDLKKKGIQKGLWKTYQKQYPWTPKIIGSNPLIMWIKTYNGEHEFFDYSKTESQRIQRAIPKEINLNWQDSFGLKFTAKITFDEIEIFKAYQKLMVETPNHKMVLQVEINEATRVIDVFLKDDKFILQLEKNNIKVYKMR